MRTLHSSYSNFPFVSVCSYQLQPSKPIPKDNLTKLSEEIDILSLKEEEDLSIMPTEMDNSVTPNMDILPSSNANNNNNNNNESSSSPIPLPSTAILSSSLLSNSSIGSDPDMNSPQIIGSGHQSHTNQAQSGTSVAEYERPPPVYSTIFLRTPNYAPFWTNCSELAPSVTLVIVNKHTVSYNKNNNIIILLQY